MKIRSLLAGCVAILISLSGQAQAGCASGQLKELNDAGLSLQEIRAACGFGGQVSSAPGTVSTSQTRSCKENEEIIKVINEDYQECLKDAQNDLREGQKECEDDYAECMSDLEPDDPPSWAKECREEHSTCQNDNTEWFDQDSPRECKNDYDKGLRKYGCK